MVVQYILWIVIVYLVLGFLLHLFYPKEALWIVTNKPYYVKKPLYHSSPLPYYISLIRYVINLFLYIIIFPWEVLETYVNPLEKARMLIQRNILTPGVDKLLQKPDVPRLVNALRRARANEDDVQEYRVVKALSEVADERALGQVIKSFINPKKIKSSLDDSIQSYAALAIGKIAQKNEDAIDILLDTLYPNLNRDAGYRYFEDKRYYFNPDRRQIDNQLKCSCMDALAIAGSKKVFQSLITGLEDHHNVAFRAHEGLVMIGERAIPTLVEELKPSSIQSTRIHVLEVLRNIGIPSPEAMRAIERIFQNNFDSIISNRDMEEIGMATLTLAEIGDQSILPVLTKAKEVYGNMIFSIYPINQSKLFSYRDKPYSEIAEIAIQEIKTRHKN